MDPDRPNRPSIDSIKIQSRFWNSEFEKFPLYARKYEDRAKEMIVGQILVLYESRLESLEYEYRTRAYGDNRKNYDCGNRSHSYA